ncbi:MAG: hypothetical protein ABEH78_06170 [Haloferacaceae archaeon]
MSGGVSDDPEELLAYLSQNHLSDGLPVIPPTEERVDRMRAAVDRAPDEILLELPTSFNELTVEALARCAVMAGCRPAYFPIVVAAFDGLADWPNLRAVMSTTSGFAVAQIVNGPIRTDLDINGGTAVFGPGYRANATIGRAVNLAFMTVGELVPGEGTMATHAQQGRYTYCFAENEEQSPWDPLHSDIAELAPEENAVTVISAQAPHHLSEGNIREYGAPDPSPDEILEATAQHAAGAASTGSTHPGEITFVPAPDHANRVAEKYTKREVKEYLYEHCRLDGERMLRSPDDARIVVAGGAGNWTSIIYSHTFSGNPATTTRIT